MICVVGGHSSSPSPLFVFGDSSATTSAHNTHAWQKTRQNTIQCGEKPNCHNRWRTTNERVDYLQNTKTARWGPKVPLCSGVSMGSQWPCEAQGPCSSRWSSERPPKHLDQTPSPPLPQPEIHVLRTQRSAGRLFRSALVDG